ncbi:hypothetical protein HDU88_003277 [Geranomyces variabilis]|nr:hypothetical protein HDU88_003277 [Geranomyces variabilis]
MVARRWIEDAVRGLEFDDLQRAAFPDHLRRMSVEYTSGGKRPTALSIRIARVIQGPAIAFPDLLIQNRPILIARAPPARGKTTLLRDFIRLHQELAPDRKVLLVDRSDEIGGASDIPRRCLRNHGADVVVVDEIGGADKASMVLDLKSRGVTVIATCHGGLAEVLKSKALGRLLGGVTSSTIGDEQAQSLLEFNKKHYEREGDSVFDTVVELAALRRWVIHHDVEAAIDACLSSAEAYVEIRELDDDGVLWTTTVGHDFAGSTWSYVGGKVAGHSVSSWTFVGSYLARASRVDIKSILLERQAAGHALGSYNGLATASGAAAGSVTGRRAAAPERSGDRKRKFSGTAAIGCAQAQRPETYEAQVIEPPEDNALAQHARTLTLEFEDAPSPPA